MNEQEIQSLREKAAQQTEQSAVLEPSRPRIPRTFYRWLWTALGIALLVAVTGLFNIYRPDLGTGNVRGRVQSLDGQPLAGVRVQIEGTDIIRQTDAQGYFEVRGVKEGIRWVLIEVPNVSGVALPVEVQEGQTTPVGPVQIYTP